MLSAPARTSSEDILKAVFNELSSNGSLVGVKPIFDGYVDLEITDARTKMVVLSHLNYSDFYGRKYNYVCQHNYFVGGFPRIDFDFGRAEFPFLEYSLLDHWNENKAELDDKIFVKFFHATSDTISSRKNHLKQEIEHHGHDSERVLLFPMFDRIDERIGEFISMLYFRGRGYISTINVPVPDDYGIPDVTCWKTPLLRELRKSGLVENGCTLQELGTLRMLGKIPSAVKGNLDESDRSIVIEVEPNAGRAYNGVVNQLLDRSRDALQKKYGYLESGRYDDGFIVAPEYSQESRVGVLTYDSKGIQFKDCPRNFSHEESKSSAIKEMDNLFAMVLLSNLTFDEIIGLVPKVKGSTFYDVMKRINQLSFDEIINAVKSVIT